MPDERVLEIECANVTLGDNEFTKELILGFADLAGNSCSVRLPRAAQMGFATAITQAVISLALDERVGDHKPTPDDLAMLVATAIRTEMAPDGQCCIDVIPLEGIPFRLFLSDTLRQHLLEVLTRAN